MPRGRILAVGGLRPRTMEALHRLAFQSGRTQPRGKTDRLAQTERHHVREMQLAGSQARPVALSRRAGERDMPDRVRALIAVARGIRRAADAHGIEHDEQRAAHAETVMRSAMSGKSGAAASPMA